MSGRLTRGYEAIKIDKRRPIVAQSSIDAGPLPIPPRRYLALFVMRRNVAGVLGGLDSLAGQHDYAVAIVFAIGDLFGLLRQVFSLLQSSLRFAVNTFGFRDLNGVARLIDGQHRFIFALRDHGAGAGGCGGPQVHGVGFGAREQFIFGGDWFGGANGVGAQNVFHHYHGAGFGYREVGLRGDQEAEGLERGGDVQLGVVFVIGDDFTQALGLTFGADVP